MNCLYLATKFNDKKELNYATMLEQIDSHFGIAPKDVLAAEFDVFTKLSFGLFVNPSDVLPHLLRLQTNIEMGNLVGPE